MKIEITGQFFAGNMGDGWKDDDEANSAFASFVEEKLTIAILEKFPDAEIVFYFELSGNSGCAREIEAYVPYVNINKQINEIIDSELFSMWDTWCRSKEAEEYWA